MSMIDISKIQGVRINEPYARTVKIIVTPETSDEVKDISLTMGIIDPHSQNDLHIHENGMEILYIVSGFGRAVIGDKEYPIKQDSLIIAPRGVVHQQINESDDTMKMFAVWTPAVSGEEVLGRAFKAAGMGE